MANTLQIKRGLKSNIPTLSEGEPAFTTDAGEFFVGDGTTNYRFIPGDQYVQTTSDVTFNTVSATNGMDAGSSKITSLANPTNATDAVNLQTLQSSAALNWTIISSNTTATRATGYLIDCSSSSVTLDLPSSPGEGDVVGVSDFTGNSENNNITINNNGNNIEGAAENLVIDINGAGFTLAYSNSTRGWVVVNEIPNRYTDEEAQDAVGTIMSGDSDISVNYDDATPAINISIDSLSQFDTDDLSEGTGNLYFTTGRVDNHLSGGNNINYSTGTIALDITSNVDFKSSYRATNLVNPSDNQDAATKSYVDSIEQGLDLKDAARAATDGVNIDLTSSTDPNPIDGVTLSNGDRILLKDQTTASENGIYDAVTATDPATWVRSADADEDSEVAAGMFVFVEEGTSNNNRGFVLTTNDPITVGTTDLNFTQFSGAGQITAGTGLNKSGDTINHDSASVHESGGAVPVNHDNLDGFVSNEHINHTNVSITGGTGLSGGGDISADRTINLDANIGTLNNVNTGTPSAGQLLIYDGTNTEFVNAGITAGTGINKSESDGSLTISTDDANIDHDSLSNFLAVEHIDWTSDVSATYTINDANINKSAVTQYSYTYSDLGLNIDDTPVDAETSEPISSNWAYDHTNAATGVHGAGSNTLLHSASTIDCGSFS